MGGDDSKADNCNLSRLKMDKVHKDWLQKERTRVFRISSAEDDWVEEVAYRAHIELAEFFDFCWYMNKPMILMVKDRKTVDMLRNQKTPDWNSGFGLYGRFAAVVDRETMGTETSHKFTKEYYEKLIKHELCHLFLEKLMGNSYPSWWVEGSCVYVSGQIEDKGKVSEFKDCLEYYESGGAGVYRESGWVVKALVEKYGKRKYLKFLQQLKGTERTREAFDENFKKAYGFVPSYEEFNKLLE